jgi:hypothetical protein
MEFDVRISGEIRKVAKELVKEYEGELSVYEALTIALKAEQNELFKRAFVISKSDAYPTALEAIVIALKEK